MYLFFFCLFYFTSTMFNNTSHNVIFGINVFVIFAFSLFSLKLAYCLKISLSVILHFLICSFLRCFVLQILYISFISFKCSEHLYHLVHFLCLPKLYQFLFLLKGEHLHLYILQLISNTFYIYKKNKKIICPNYLNCLQTRYFFWIHII